MCVSVCVNVLFVVSCVLLCGLFVVVFVCAFRCRFVFDVLCVRWLAFVLCFCGWVFLFNMVVCSISDLLCEFVWWVCLCVFV